MAVQQEIVCPDDPQKQKHIGEGEVQSDDADEPLIIEVGTPEAAGTDAAISTVQIGMACYATSAFFFALMAVFVKLAGREGIPTWEIIFLRSCVVLTGTLPRILCAGDNPFGHRKLLLAFRGLTGFGSNSALFFAVQIIPLADMSVFTFLTPIFVAIVSPLVLKEHLAPGSFLCCAMCMVGVLLVAQPPFIFGEGRLTLEACAVGLLHPVLSACAKASIRVLTRTETDMVIVFYLSLFTLTGSFIAMVVVPGQYRPIANVYEAAVVIAAGLCGYGTQAFMNMGLRRVKAAQAGTMSYSGIVWSGIAGVLIFREYPNLFSGIGDGVIIASTLLFALRSTGFFRRKERGVQAAAEPAVRDASEPLLPEQHEASQAIPVPLSRGAGRA